MRLQSHETQNRCVFFSRSASPFLLTSGGCPLDPLVAPLHGADLWGGLVPSPKHHQPRQEKLFVQIYPSPKGELCFSRFARDPFTSFHENKLPFS